MVRSSRSARMSAAGALLAGLLLLAIVATQATAATTDFGLTLAPDEADNPTPAYASGEVIVRFDPATAPAERAQARADAGTAAPESLGLPGLQLVQIRDGETVAETVSELEADPAVRYAEPNLTYSVATLPNDPLIGSLWGLENTGQGVDGFATPSPDADIDAERAWGVETGDTGTVLAVMDTGIDLAHPDLAPQLWQNPGEAAGTPGVDDDGNGKVDDTVGWDFLNTGSNDSTPEAEDNDPSDLQGHGTHVAGTALARGNNGVGITGVAQQGAIMPLRVCAAYDGTCPIADQVEAINYAAAEGADVLNGSISGDGVSQAIRDTLNAHPSMLFVFAAGNDAENNEVTPQGPCQADQVGTGAYTANNVICVNATDQADNLASFSNYGSTSVDLAAPGSEILSTSARRIFFSDNFESDNFATRWTPSPGSDWGRTNEAPLTSFGVSDSPGGNYDPSSEYELTSEDILLPAGYSSCRLNYFRSTVLGNGDRFDLEVLLNGIARQSISFSGPENSSRTTFISLNPLFDIGGTVNIRLRVTANQNNGGDGVHMDDISLACSGAPSDGAYELRQGTSMAAPHVSGTAALIMARDPQATPTQVKQLILGTADPKASLAGKNVTGARLNAGDALEASPAHTTITGGSVAEGATTTDRTATFTYASTEASPTFQCAVDNGAYSLCTGTTPVLANGQHTFRVRTVDPRGNVETTPATRTFTVDSAPSGMEITDGPAEGATISDRTPTFAFTSDEVGATFKCKIEAGATLGPAPFAPCSDAAGHTAATLADGTWTLWVEAYDDTDALVGEASRTFHIDATPPQTTLSGGPAPVIRSTSVDFTFSAPEPTDFECRLDSTEALDWSPCASPKHYSGLANGTHKFEVRAVDAVGNRDGSPAETSFTVDTQAPAVSVIDSPAPLTNDPTPGFSFTADPGATVECSIDRGTASYTHCASSRRHQPGAPLADGNWNFRVRATDPAGNASVATRSFRVDTTAPRTRIARKPGKRLTTRKRSRAVSFRFAANESARFLCAVDRKPLRSCSRRVTRRLRVGRHRMRVVAIDNAGNRDATPAVYRFRIKRAS